VLDLKGFNLNDKLELDPDFLLTEQTHEEGHVHDEHCGHDHHHHDRRDHDHHDHHHSHHSDDIAAFVFKSNRPFDTAKLDEFLGGLVNVYGPRMLRYKGVLFMRTPTARWCSRACTRSWAAISAPNGEKTTFVAAKWYLSAKICPKTSLLAV
jgi:G3E family GTPase